MSTPTTDPTGDAVVDAALARLPGTERAADVIGEVAALVRLHDALRARLDVTAP